jgi:hypothetical protein
MASLIGADAQPDHKTDGHNDFQEQQLVPEFHGRIMKRTDIHDQEGTEVPVRKAMVR